MSARSIVLNGLDVIRTDSFAIGAMCCSQTNRVFCFIELTEGFMFDVERVKGTTKTVWSALLPVVVDQSMFGVPFTMEADPTS